MDQADKDHKQKTQEYNAAKDDADKKSAKAAALDKISQEKQGDLDTALTN